MVSFFSEAWVDSANSTDSTDSTDSTESTALTALTELTELAIKPNMAAINHQMEPNMQALTFRNQQGDLVDLTIVAASEIKLRFGALLDSVVHGAPVAISKHDEPKAVLLSVDEFRALVALRQSSLDVMTSEFDELLESMQTKQAKTGIAKAFASSPKQLGAVAAAVTSPAAVTSTAKAKTKLRGKAEKTSAKGLPKSARMTHSTRSTLVKR